VRVCDLVEHDEDAVWIDLIETDGSKLLGLERNPLMHGVRSEQPIEIARGGWLDGHATLGDEGC
jgi:hypothetical protein